MSVSLTSGNTCPSGYSHISSWQTCRAALSIYSALDPSNEIFGQDYQGVEPGGPSEDWPKGCYYCKNVPNCSNGVWFNGASEGSVVQNGQIFCGDEHFESMINTDQSTRLFVGDSDIDYWTQVESSFGTSFPNTSDDIDGIAAYNVGVGGYTCVDVFAETSSFIEAFSPNQVVLVCGENDLFEYSVQKTFENYQKVVSAYIESGTKVVSISTKPEPSTAYLHSKYRQLDIKIKEWAASDLSASDFVFIDSYYGFEDLGNGNNLYAGDRLHLSSLGYSYWEEWLEIALADTTNSCQLWRSGECTSSSSGTCTDTTLRFKVRKNSGKMISRDCRWVSNNSDNRCSLIGVSATCPNTCESCDVCEDSTLRFKVIKNDGKKITRDCTWVSNRATGRCGFDGVSEICRVTCGNC